MKGGFKSIALANAVILVFVLFWKHPFVFSKLAGMLDFGVSMIFGKHGCKVLSIRGFNGESSILDPIKNW